MEASNWQMRQLKTPLRASACCREANRSTLPLSPLGNTDTNSSTRGYLLGGNLLLGSEMRVNPRRRLRERLNLLGLVGREIVADEMNLFVARLHKAWRNRVGRGNYTPSPSQIRT